MHGYVAGCGDLRTVVVRSKVAAWRGGKVGEASATVVWATSCKRKQSEKERGRTLYVLLSITRRREDEVREEGACSCLIWRGRQHGQWRKTVTPSACTNM